MKSAGKARSNGLYRHIRTSKEIIRNLLNDSFLTVKYAMDMLTKCLKCYTIFLEQFVRNLCTLTKEVNNEKIL